MNDIILAMIWSQNCNSKIMNESNSTDEDSSKSVIAQLGLLDTGNF